MSYTNTTIDDTSSSITYNGEWDPPSDVAYTPLDYDGTHHLSENGGTATFTFTGVAIYFWSPLWPYLVNTMVTVDGQDGTCINLQDTSGATSVNGEETQPSIPRWGVDGLDNTQHTLVVSGCPGGPYVVLDALTYTEYTPAPPPPSSTSTSSTSSTSSASTQTHAANLSSTKHTTVIAIGSSVAAVVAILLIALVVICCHRRPDRKRAHIDLLAAESPTPNNPFNSPPNSMTGLGSPVSYHHVFMSQSPPNLPEL